MEQLQVMTRPKVQLKGGQRQTSLEVKRSMSGEARRLGFHKWICSFYSKLLFLRKCHFEEF